MSRGDEMTRRVLAPTTTRGRLGPSLGRLLSLGILSVMLHGPAVAVENASNTPPGATLETVLTLAKQLNPEHKARVLETEAARAGVEIADSLPDPTLKITSDEIDQPSGPRQNKMIYSIEQDIPLWGKRDLKRSAAQALVDQRSAEAQSSEAELIEKVKVVFAQYYRAVRAIHATEDLHHAIHDVAQTAQARYAQGREAQQEIFRTQIEITRLETELARQAVARSTAQRQLNILIGRPADAPLAEPQELPVRIPPELLNPDALLELARTKNPQLIASSAEIEGARNEEALAAKSWYPDVTVGTGAIDRTGNGPNGYMAWVGFRVPLQWGLHEAQEHEATAKASAAEARRQAVAQQLANDLAETASTLKGTRTIAKLTKTQLLPQNEALLRSATASYAAGKTSLQEVLKIEHDLADIRIQLLDFEFDEQRQLAAIERMIGGEL